MKKKKVSINSKVKIKDEKNEMIFTLVNSGEIDLKEGKISTYSPVGRALLNKKMEDEIKVITPQGVKKYKIVAID